MLSGIEQDVVAARFREGMQVAQVRPEQAQRDQLESVEFFPFFRKLCDDILRRQLSLWRGDYLEWTRTALYYNGHQILVPSGLFGYTIQRLRGSNHNLYVFNKLRPVSDTVTASWTQASPEVLFAVLEQQSRKARRAVWEIEALNEYFNYCHFPEDIRQGIAKGGQFCGNYHAETYWDDEAEGTEWREHYQQIQVPPSYWYECLDCGSAGSLPADGNAYTPACPTCGGQLLLEQQEGFVYPQLEREGWERAGDVRVRIVPAWCMRYSRTTGPALSPYRYVGEDHPKEVLEAKYGKLPQSAVGEEWARDEMMLPERILRRAARQEAGNTEDDRECILQQRFWFDPEMYLFAKLAAPVTLPDGEQLPAGTRLAEAFPTGIRLLTVPGAERFLSVARESHRQRFQDGRYGITYGSNVGHGIEDTVNNQRHYNVFRSGLAKYFNAFLVPSVAVDARVFPDKKLFNRQDPVIPTNTMMPEGVTVSQGYSIIQPPAINPQVWNLLEMYNADIKEGAKAFDSQGDYVGAANDTATAARIGLGKSSMLTNLHLALFAGWMKEIAVRRIELARDHYGDQRLITAASGDRQRVARVLKAVHLRSSIVAWIKPGSYAPDLKLERQEAAMARLQAQAQLQALGMDTPDNRRVLDEIFQSDLGRDTTASRLDICDDALDQMLEAFEAAGGLLPPEMLAAMAPTDLYEVELDQRMAWWRSWLSSPEGHAAPDAIRAAVHLVIEQLWMGIQQQQMSFAGLPMMGAVAGAPVVSSVNASPGGMAAQKKNGGADSLGLPSV